MHCIFKSFHLLLSDFKSIFLKKFILAPYWPWCSPFPLLLILNNWKIQKLERIVQNILNLHQDSVACNLGGRILLLRFSPCVLSGETCGHPDSWPRSWRLAWEQDVLLHIHTGITTPQNFNIGSVIPSPSPCLDFFSYPPDVFMSSSAFRI